jgi:hypothetical protein
MERRASSPVRVEIRHPLRHVIPKLGVFTSGVKDLARC